VRAPSPSRNAVVGVLPEEPNRRRRPRRRGAERSRPA